MATKRVMMAGGAALALVLVLGACGPSQPAATANAPAPAPVNQIAAATPVAPAPDQPAAPAEKQTAQDVFGDVGVPAPASEQGAHPDRSGATRRARCRIDDQALASCAFTPVLGDGSFDVDMDGYHMRLVISDGEGALFARGEDRNIPIPGVFQRDPADRACWASDEEFATVHRLCAY